MCIGRSRETVKENRTKYVKNQFDMKYFGTDGIRGIYGETLCDDLAYLVGNFLGYSADGGKVVLGRDTRISGEKTVQRDYKRHYRRRRGRDKPRYSADTRRVFRHA